MAAYGSLLFSIAGNCGSGVIGKGDFCPCVRLLRLIIQRLLDGAGALL